MVFPQEHPFPQNSSVVAYLRDSGGDDQELSTAQQQDYIIKWCRENQLHLTEIFADAAQPGSSTIGRTQFAAMIQHFHNPDCQDAGLIVWNLSRFSRNLDDSQYFRADLRRRGYIIHSLQDNIPNNANGRIIEFLHDWKNESVLVESSVTIKRGLNFLVNNYHAMPGNPPRGFKREVQTIGKHRNGSPHTISRWIPDPETWPICQQAWQMRTAGLSIRQIHKKLHLYGSLNSYTWFFTNRIYLGELKYDEIIFKDYTEPMITQEVWDMVQKMNQKNHDGYNPMKGENNTRHPRRANSSYILSGLIHCALCGSLMNGSTVKLPNNKRLEYYHCDRAQRKMECIARRIPKKLMEDLVIEKLREYVLDPRVILERDKELALAQSGKSDRVKNEISILSGRINNNQRKMDNLGHRIAEEDDPPRTLVSMLHELELDDQTMRAELDRLKSILNQEVVFVRSPEQLEKLAKNITWSLTSDDIKIKRDAIRSLVDRIVAERDGDYIRGMVTFWNPDEDPVNMPTNQSHRRESNP